MGTEGGGGGRGAGGEIIVDTTPTGTGRGEEGEAMVAVGKVIGVGRVAKGTVAGFGDTLG